MRVCFLTPYFDAFKGGNHLPLLAALPEVEFTILTNDTKPALPDLPGNVRCETLRARVSSYYYGCADLLFARAVLKHYPASDPFWKQFDVIHINQTMGPALLQLKKAGVPIVFFIHHPVSADRAVALEESSFIGRIFWRLKYWLLVLWQKRFCTLLPTIATVSQTSAKRIAQDYGCPESKITVIPNGIDTTVFTPDDPAFCEFDAIAVGSFVHPRKGFRYLVEVYRELSIKSIRIADVGRRSPEQQAIIRSIKNVRSLGTVPQEKLLSLLRRSSVLLSTSLYEGFGLSLIEALACGRPAFAFDAGAVREVLAPVDPDLVVALRDTDELTRRVQKFLALSPAERAEKGRRYREGVSRLYPLKKSAAALHDLYKKLSGKR